MEDDILRFIIHPIYYEWGAAGAAPKVQDIRAASSVLWAGCTLRVFEDNVLVREFLEEKGDDRVLVVDGGWQLEVRDIGGEPGGSSTEQRVGRALSSHPMKASKKGLGEKHLPVHFGGTRICDGEWLYADTDGILVSKSELSV
ncbi:hypothetical protein SASPL_110734 [Salvia splendens]|uniref:4-hydroxy-4-methyl-2-oxoglutarate aldolase n=1 Tax=Salvia splendens TaxID=180675 RepID=A0A8X8Y559_SALSN|nr:hypothetical protein SASPL_110734 [Salvia splendens]